MMPTQPRRDPTFLAIAAVVATTAGYLLARVSTNQQPPNDHAALHSTVDLAVNDRPPIVLAQFPAEDGSIQQQSSKPDSRQEETPKSESPALPMALPAEAEAAPPAASQADYALQHLRADELRTRLEQAFAKQLPSLSPPNDPWIRFSVDLGDGVPVLLAAERRTGTVRIVGRADQLVAWRSILIAIDAPQAAEKETRLVAANHSAAPQIRRAVDVLAAQGQAPATAPPHADTEPAPEISDAGEALLGPVQIDVVEGTDLFVIRGNPRDVARVMEVIRQLEELSEVSEPRVEVIPLEHIDSQVLSLVLRQLFAAQPSDGQYALRPYYGPLLVQPLGRPNAVLLAGAPSTVGKAAELVDQLDVAGGAGATEVRVFKLRHALATDLAPVLQRAIRGESPDQQQNEETTAALASILKLVTIDAQGQQKLQSGVLAGATINSDARSNSLVATAPGDSMSLLAALVEQLDQPSDVAAQLKVFTIQNGDATALAQMLSALFGAGNSGSGDQGGGNQAGAPGVFGIRFSVDERTNSIIAAGSEEELLVVEAVLLRLDSADARQRLNRVYKLKNASAQDVATALQDWLERKREIDQTAPGVASPFQQLEREVVVVPEVASNSLIVSATPAYYREIEGIVAQLDEQAPMVLIQVLIGEMRLGDADEFGVELGLQDSVLFDRSLLSNLTTTETTATTQVAGSINTVQQQVIQGADLTPGYRFGDPALGLPNSGSDRSLATAGTVAAQGISNFAVNRISPDLNFGGFVLSASSNAVSLLLRALQESRRLEILSRPQIMALDNQTGRAFVGEIVPIITSSTTNNFGNPINSVTPAPVGLELLVTPRISPEDLVVMQVSAAKRELGPLDQGVPIAISPNGDPIRVPRINSTEAQTTVSAVSGQTVVLSGLLTKRDEALHRRVPLLADIPLLGDLFRYDSSRLVRTELLIILTPHVIRSRHDSEVLKQVESARMSWCLSDVVEMHGPAGLRSRDDSLGAAEAPAIYPSATPEEIQGLVPTPAEQYITPTEPTVEQISPPPALPPALPPPMLPPPDIHQ
jgi:type II secretion system protein D